MADDDVWELELSRLEVYDFEFCECELGDAVKTHWNPIGHDGETCIWKAPVIFKDSGVGYSVLRVKDVLVAACPDGGGTYGDNYGKTFAYIGLPRDLRRLVGVSTESFGCEIDEVCFLPTMDLEPDRELSEEEPGPDVWWRTVWDTKNLAVLGGIDNYGRAVQKKHSVADIIEKTQKTFTITADLKFAVCAEPTADGLPPSLGNWNALSVEVIKGVLTSVNDKRKGPVVLSTPSTASPTADSSSEDPFVIPTVPII